MAEGVEGKGILCASGRESKSCESEERRKDSQIKGLRHIRQNLKERRRVAHRPAVLPRTASNRENASSQTDISSSSIEQLPPLPPLRLEIANPRSSPNSSIQVIISRLERFLPILLSDGRARRRTRRVVVVDEGGGKGRCWRLTSFRAREDEWGEELGE